MKKTLLALIMPCLAIGVNARTTAGFRVADHLHIIKNNTGALKAIDAIKGTVKDASGQPLIGVNIQVKGTNRGTQSDVNGAFTVQASAGEILVVSYIGYTKKEVTVVGPAVALNIVLSEDSKTLGEVVVTALGIKKSEKSITYASQQIGGSELTRVKSDNLMNSLNGKISGVTISPSASGVGGSAKVILRGNKSAAGNNQPLYVIDGIPISNGSNSNAQPTNTFGTSVGQGGSGMPSTNQDGGDGISNLNPDDIESITVLKGASASALYGSQAQNGVILITTKKGKAGKTSISFTSSASIDHIAYKPDFQNSYGQTAGGADSWGDKISSGHDNLSDFYQNGTNFTNSINLSGGSDIAQTYFSYANTSARGVEPGNKLVRNNFNFRETGHFLNDKLTVDGNITYVDQKINNSPGLGLYLNPLTGLYLFPRGRDILPYKNQFELPPVPVTGNGAPTQNWPFNEDIQQNPWWVTNRNPNTAQRNRILINGSVKYDFTKWLSLQVRGNLDRFNDVYQQNLYAGTNPVLSKSNGQLLLTNQTTEQKYGDALLTFTVPGKSDLKVDGVLGASITDAKTIGNIIGPNTSNAYTGTGLLIPNVFLPENLVSAAGAPPVSTLPENHNQIQSLFASANLAYKNWAYLTLTGRNDWSSNLSFTPNGSYFYPSAGLSFILNQMFELPKAITYAKIRGTYAQVGNTVPSYVTDPYTHFAPGGVILNGNAPFHELKPERTKSFELGFDTRFFDDALTVNFTYYKSNTINQFIRVTPSTLTTYTQGFVNAGNVQNSGIEFMVGYDVIKNSSFSWNTAFNGSANKNKVIDVDSKDGIDDFILTPNFNNTYESRLTKGGSFGDIYGVTIKHDAQGRIMLGADGKPITEDGYNYIGNPNPKFQLGWSNTFNYKKFTFSFLVDGKFGGQVLSLTQAVMDKYGVSKVTGDARNAGSVPVNAVDPTGKAVSSVDPKLWYTTIGGRDGISSQYIYSATVVRLREVSLGYTLPLTKSVFKSLRFAVTGRNLLYFHKDAPYDPEVTMSTGNGLSGVDTFNQPATRNFGFNLNVTL